MSIVRAGVLVACSLLCPALSAAAAGPGYAGELVRADVTGPEVRGISGLSIGPGGVFYAVPERERHLLSFTLSRSSTDAVPRMLASVPISGVPAGFDLESIAWVGGDRFALGTESLVPSRSKDKILFAKLEGKRLVVRGSLDFDYRPFGMRAGINAGIEGLCYADGVLVAAAETVVEQPVRHTALAAYQVAKKRWSTYRLALTTDTGKISALACRSVHGTDELEVLAFERHYAVARVLSFRIPKSPGPDAGTLTELQPSVLVDIGALLGPKPPNFEGIEWAGERDILLISDNDYGGTAGPMIVLRVR